MEDKLEKAIEALSFYADPKIYHGISLSGHGSVGEFINDFSQHHGDENYPHPMLGALARKTLDEITES